MQGKKPLSILLDVDYIEHLKQLAIDETHKHRRFITHVELVRQAIEQAYPPKPQEDKQNECA